jgi:hypothetical protein
MDTFVGVSLIRLPGIVRVPPSISSDGASTRRVLSGGSVSLEAFDVDRDAAL